MKTYKVTVDSEGTTRWYNESHKLHREDGPAVEWADGSRAWYIRGQLHREDGPAAERADGSKEWRLNGELHREDGPAVERANGYKAWYIRGQLHRKDGPAIEWSDGDKFWYLNGERLTEEEFISLTRQAKELTVAQVEEKLGYKIKIIK